MRKPLTVQARPWNPAQTLATPLAVCFAFLCQQQCCGSTSCTPTSWAWHCCQCEQRGQPQRSVSHPDLFWLRTRASLSNCPTLHSTFSAVTRMQRHDCICTSSIWPSIRSDAVHLTRSQFILVLWRRVLTPFQAARIAIAAYPSVDVDMDVLAVIKCAGRPNLMLVLECCARPCCPLRRNAS
jgi:hypothetical protein